MVYTTHLITYLSNTCLMVKSQSSNQSTTSLHSFLQPRHDSHAAVRRLDGWTLHNEAADSPVDKRLRKRLKNGALTNKNHETCGFEMF